MATPPPAPAAIAWNKVQGIIPRGYRQSFVRHLALSVRDAAAAKAFIGDLVSGRPGTPQITTAEGWIPPKPDYCLNISFTYPGLVILLGANSASVASFQTYSHQSFVNGSAASAAVVGDVGASAPTTPWVVDDRNFHVMLSIYAVSMAELDAQTELLKPLLAAGFGALTADRMFDSQALRNDEVYFGYHDNIAQPIIAGSPFPRHPDGQEPVDPGAFLLGTAQTIFFQMVAVPTPAAFGLYGCFGAFRILKQDVEGFEKQIENLASQMSAFGIECPKTQQAAVMAKICGRWPNGTPLALAPIDGDTIPDEMPPQDLNNFQFNLPKGDPKQDPNLNPDLGTNVPIGCHIRRGNMRSSPAGEGNAQNHRIMRRAMPYQLDYKDGTSRDTGERGLMGFFLGSTLVGQFEFVQQNWINNSSGFSSVGDPADPLMGGEDPEYISTPTEPESEVQLQPLESFVTTRGSAYVYFPGIDGIGYIAAAPVDPPVTPAPSAGDSPPGTGSGLSAGA
jgi:deferrochelatase/peroxidase EfeB